MLMNTTSGTFHFRPHRQVRIRNGIFAKSHVALVIDTTPSRISSRAGLQQFRPCSPAWSTCTCVIRRNYLMSKHAARYPTDRLAIRTCNGYVRSHMPISAHGLDICQIDSRVRLYRSSISWHRHQPPPSLNSTTFDNR
jgi:hypothetical protein